MLSLGSAFKCFQDWEGVGVWGGEEYLPNVIAMTYPCVFPERVDYQPVHTGGVRRQAWDDDVVGTGHLLPRVLSCHLSFRLQDTINLTIPASIILYFI